jgi:outer membrane biogenesis lipoprotein LolB
MSGEKENDFKVSYKFFWNYFKENYNLHFGHPVVKMLVLCVRNCNKIKSSTLNDSAKRAAVAELLVHKCHAKIVLHCIKRC